MFNPQDPSGRMFMGLPQGTEGAFGMGAPGFAQGPLGPPSRQSPSITTGYGPGNTVNVNTQGPAPSMGGPNMAALLAALMSRKQQPSAPMRRPDPVLPPMASGGESPSGMRGPMRNRLTQYGPTARDLGRFQMNQTGNWGVFTDAADIPAGLQGKVMPGFYGGVGNWDTSNPMILGAKAYGKWDPSGGGSLGGIGGGAGVQQQKSAMDEWYDMPEFTRRKILEQRMSGGEKKG